MNAGAPIVFVLGLLHAVSVHAEQAERPPPRTLSPLLAAGLWTAAQLVPSPLVVVSPRHAGAGVRWQVTPLLYSFGVAEKPLRSFVVDPVARHSGALELFFSPEWACCAPAGRSSWMARTGARMYWPLVLRGEALSASFGGSYVFASPRGAPAAEVGVYVLSSILGLTLTVAPTLEGRTLIFAFVLHYY